MKKLLLIAAVASLSAPALASKARLSALGTSAHLKDTQTVFDNPAHLNLMSDYVTFETGPTSTTSTTSDAEGGFVRSAGDAKYMAYLGRKSAFTTGVRAAGGFQGQENPIELQYAMKGAINWGVGLNYSNSQKKSSAGATDPAKKQEAYGLRLGAVTDIWEAYATIGLSSKATGASAVAGGYNLADDPDATFKGTTGFKVGGAYKMENLYMYVDYYQDGFKYESTVGANALATNGLEWKQNQATVGVVDHNKIEGGQWFYGVAYQIYSQKKEGAVAAAVNTKTDTTSLPFLLGLEYDATTWATFRASVRQNVLLGSTKTDNDASTTDGEADTIANNTTVAAGLGLKFNKWVLDGSMAASTTGDVNTANFLTNVGLTYTF